MNSIKKWRLVLLPLFLIANTAFANEIDNTSINNRSTLSLKLAITAAVRNDPWLQTNRHQQDSIESMSVAASTLPDPKISIGMKNIAADSFDFGQEAMTNFNLGISQMIPRGDSLEIKSRQLRLAASEFPLQRDNRSAWVTVRAGKLWLDVYKAQQSIALIDNDRALFEQLADVAQASYASTVGKTRQQDIVRAQLELTRLDDRLTILKQQQETRMQELSGLLNDNFVSNYLQSQIDEPSSVTLPYWRVSEKIPNIKMLEPELYLSKKTIDQPIIFEYLSKHPSILAIDQRIKASKSGINLAKQQYKPQWGINAGYGYRDSDPFGSDRSDLFSIGISFDIPLFTANRQDKQVQSAVSKSEATKIQKWLLARKLIASFESARVQLIRLNQRQTLFQKKLLPQMHDQAEASLTAYTNDDGDFSEVVRSRIAELNAAIDSLGIDVERQKSIIQLNYFFMNRADQIVLNNSDLATSYNRLGEK